MAKEAESSRKQRDVGRGSPASEEASEQGMSGARGAEEAERGEPAGENTRDGRQSTGVTRPGHRAEG